MKSSLNKKHAQDQLKIKKEKTRWSNRVLLLILPFFVSLHECNVAE